jgi:4-amino-4-deoxy-L-arabinose transferase-like glycosyltransferase
LTTVAQVVGAADPCHASWVEARTYSAPHVAAGLTAARARILVCACLLGLGLLVRVDGIDRPSLATRELHNALLARQYYFDHRSDMPVWQRHVLAALRTSVQPVEPPLLDHAAAWGYRLLGGERLWFPRLLSMLCWLGGGVFLYLIGRRVTSADGAVVALALYLFWPYGIVMSRLYMPDPAMVALILAGAWAVIRYWEKRTPRRLAGAVGTAALATLVKPGIALLFLAALFCALALARRELLTAIRRGTLPAFIVASALPTVAYYIYGSYIRHFLRAEGDARHRLEPHVILSGRFWSGWWHQLSTVLPFPQRQADLVLVPLLAGLGGLLAARDREARAILAGLGLGYVAYALAVAGYTADNDYYALPVLPILALAIGALAGFVGDRAGLRGGAALAAAGLVAVLLVAVGAYKSRPGGADRAAIDDYRRIGALTHHTTAALIVDPRLRTPAMYWGWIVGHYWYQPTPGRDLPASGYPFPPWVDAARTSYLVVTDVGELRSEPRLAALVRRLPVLARTHRFAVFDARGGRLARAARGS